MGDNYKYRGSKAYYLVYSELITAARYRGTITYQEIAKIMGLPMSGNYMGSQIGWVLGEISEEEVKNGRPMLSAIAVSAKGKPNPGFYNWVRKLYDLKDDENFDEEAFWNEECTKVYETWKVELSK